MYNPLSKKAQSALEYMMTYGWAILIIVIVAVILYSMGIFNPSSSISATITGFASAPVSSAICTSNGVLRFAVGDTTSNIIKIKNITATIGSKTVTFTPNATIDPNPTIAPGSTYTFSVPNICPSAGNHFLAAVTINYMEPSSSFPSAIYPSSGSITGTVSSNSAPAYVAVFTGPISSTATYSNPYQPPSEGSPDISRINISLTSNPAINKTLKSGSFSLSAWIYQLPNVVTCEINVFGLYNPVASFRFGVSGYSSWILGNKIMLELFNNSGGTTTQTNMFGGPVKNSSWENLIATYNDSYVNFYINGKLSSSSYYSKANITLSSLGLIGSGLAGCDDQFIGDMANLQFYNESLTGNQISSIFSKGMGSYPINKQFVGYWPLNGTAKDYSGNNYNGVATSVVFYTSNYPIS